MDRRDFMKGLGAGAVVVAAPGFVSDGYTKTLSNGLTVLLDDKQSSVLLLGKNSVSVNPLAVEVWGEIYLDDNSARISGWTISSSQMPSEFDFIRFYGRKNIAVFHCDFSGWQDRGYFITQSSSRIIHENPYISN